MKIWILIGVAVVLLVWSLTRERFEPTATIRAPPYEPAHLREIYNMLNPQSKEFLKRVSGGGEANLQRVIDFVADNVVGQFYLRVYKPATTPITAADIDAYIARMSAATPTGSIPAEEREIMKDMLTAYFINQQAPATAGLSDKDALAAGLAAAVAGGVSKNDERVVTALAASGDHSGFPATTAVTNSFTVETPIPAEAKTRTLAESRTMSGFGPTAGCPPGFEVRDGTCKPNTEASDGATDRLRQVFGPLLTGRGSASAGEQSATDSSKTNVYPELLGGVPKPSKEKSVLPTTASLGLDGDAKFFPHSRQPGDMDIIPDPYRVSSTFSQSSYSSKTEPTPFLTDFSAFLK